VFRIHRDVRFSKDKKPYKTHVSATLTRDGQKMSPGMLYVHIEPEGGPSRPSIPRPSTRWIPRPCPPAQDGQNDSYAGGGPFAAAGFYLTERPHIDAFRRAIVADPKGWAAVEKALTARNCRWRPASPPSACPRASRTRPAVRWKRR
jgi:uncharacterized protein (DUF2461 family)